MLSCPYCGESMHLIIEKKVKDGVILCSKCNVTIEIKTRDANHNHVMHELESLGVLYLKIQDMQIKKTEGWLTLATYISEQKRDYADRARERKMILNAIHGKKPTSSSRLRKGVLYAFAPVSHKQAMRLIKEFGKMTLKHSGEPIKMLREYVVITNYIKTCEEADNNFRAIKTVSKKGENYIASMKDLPPASPESRAKYKQMNLLTKKWLFAGTNWGSKK